MAEDHDRPIPGNGNNVRGNDGDRRVPFRRFDGDGDRDGRRSGHRSERDTEEHRGHDRQGYSYRSRSRGYQTDRPPQSSSRPSRWDSGNHKTDRNRDRRDYDDDNYHDGESHRRRRGIAADKEINNSRGSDDRFRRDGNREERYNEDRRRRRGESFYQDDDTDDRYHHRRHRRERSDSGYRSDEYGDSRRRDPRNYERSSFDRRDYRRRRSRDFTSDEDDYDEYDDRSNNREEITNKKQSPKEPKEWPPSFRKGESAYTFDTRSAMFYEPLSDFFYDPKSKLYYGNKKCAYFRYDEKEDPPFVEVQKMTIEQVEEQKRGETGGIAQENVHATTVVAPIVVKPKIAIKFKTTKVKSSVSTLAARECDNQLQPAMVSKAKQQQIANIGKWNEKQAELKERSHAPPETAASDEAHSQRPKKVRTTAKGEPICMVCKKKFPNLAKLRLHEKGSELHKKNLRALQEKRKAKLSTGAAGSKRKLDEKKTDATLYTDRAEKRRQLHGTDLCAASSNLSQPLLHLPQAKAPQTSDSIEPTKPGTDLMDENNVGLKMLQKMGYSADQKKPQHSAGSPNSSKDANRQKIANEHLRKEWDRIEAMAQKSVPQNRYNS